MKFELSKEGFIHAYTDEGDTLMLPIFSDTNFYGQELKEVFEFLQQYGEVALEELNKYRGGI